jgi:hypothetical protein
MLRANRPQLLDSRPEKINSCDPVTRAFKAGENQLVRSGDSDQTLVQFTYYSEHHILKDINIYGQSLMHSGSVTSK